MSADPYPGPAAHVTPGEEIRITREVLALLALDCLYAAGGRIVIPDDASPEFVERVRAVEGPLLWALGYDSGPRWGCAGIPAREATWLPL